MHAVSVEVACFSLRISFTDLSSSANVGESRANMPQERFGRKCIIISKHTPLKMEVESTEAQSMTFPHYSLTCLGQFSSQLNFLEAVGAIGCFSRGVRDWRTAQWFQDTPNIHVNGS